MSLTDTDKNSDKRGNPQLNQNDQILHRMANATTSVHPVTDSTTTSGYLQTSNGRILGNDGTNNVGLFGFDDNGDMVVKVAKPGYDANNAANENLIFNSAQNVFKIVSRGTTTIPSFSIAAGGNSIRTIAHGLSTTPIVNFYVQATLLNWSTGTQLTSSYVPAPLVNNTSSTTGYLFQAANSLYYPIIITTAVDATNIYIQAVYTSSVATTINAIPVTYFVLQETAA